MNILFTCAGRRNYLLNYFKENLKDSDRIIATDMQLSAPAMVEADIAIQVPDVYSHNYVNTLVEICKKYKVSALIPLNDLELPILSANKNKIEELGTTVIVSDYEVVDICLDKLKTHEFIKNIGLNSIETYVDYRKLLDNINEKTLSFPLVIKPRWGSASIGINYPKSIRELELCKELLEIKLPQTFLNNMSEQDIEHAILYQRKINGIEYGLDIINDLEGNYLTTIVKKKLAMRAGETDKAIIVNNTDIVRIGEKIGKSLRHIGNLDCDVFEENGEYYVLEMNPRFGGGFPFSYEAKVNLPGLIIKLLNGEFPDFNILTPEFNKSFAKCDRLISIPI